MTFTLILIYFIFNCIFLKQIFKCLEIKNIFRQILFLQTLEVQNSPTKFQQKLNQKTSPGTRKTITVFFLIVRLFLLDRPLLINRPPRGRLKNKPTPSIRPTPSIKPTPLFPALMLCLLCFIAIFFLFFKSNYKFPHEKGIFHRKRS